MLTKTVHLTKFSVQNSAEQICNTTESFLGLELQFSTIRYIRPARLADMHSASLLGVCSEHWHNSILFNLVVCAVVQSTGVWKRGRRFRTPSRSMSHSSSSQRIESKSHSIHGQSYEQVVPKIDWIYAGHESTQMTIFPLPKSSNQIHDTNFQKETVIFLVRYLPIGLILLMLFE